MKRLFLAVACMLLFTGFSYSAEQKKEKQKEKSEQVLLEASNAKDVMSYLSNNLSRYIITEHFYELILEFLIDEEKNISISEFIELLNIKKLAKDLNVSEESVKNILLLNKYVKMNSSYDLGIKFCNGTCSIASLIKSLKLEEITKDFKLDKNTCKQLMQKLSDPEKKDLVIKLFDKLPATVKRKVIARLSPSNIDKLKGGIVGFGAVSVSYFLSRALCLSCVEFLTPNSLGTAGALSLAASYALYKAYKVLQTNGTTNWDVVLGVLLINGLAPAISEQFFEESEKPKESDNSIDIDIDDSMFNIDYVDKPKKAAKNVNSDEKRKDSDK